MSLVSVLGEYRQICEELGLQPLLALEKAFAASPEKVDLILLIVSSKHFESLIKLLERRDDIERVDLSGIKITMTQLVRLFSVLSDGCVKELILRNVHLGIQGGEAVRKLSIACDDLIYVDLTGTLLPEYLEASIKTQVEMNNICFQKKMQYWQKAVEPEAPRSWRWRVESWTEENETEPKKPVLKSMQNDSLWGIARSVMEGGVLFTDKEFPPEEALKNPNVTWIRVSSLLTEAKKRECCCVGEKPLYHSRYNDTKNFCAALNVVQQFHHLSKQLCVRRLPNLGLFAFCFCIRSSLVTVIVDDQIPFLNGEPAGIHHGRDSDDYWGCLVEKAFAKLYGGYDNISGVTFGSALSQLTGGITFAIDWKFLRQKFTETELFRFLRDLTNSKKVLAARLIPRNSMAMLSAKEKGIEPHMSYVVTATEAHRDEKPHPSYMVQLSCPNKLESEDTFFISYSKMKSVSGLPRYWIGFEDFLTYFDKICLLLWPRNDPLTNHKNVVEHICECFGGTDSSSKFATNPSFLLTNMGKPQSEIMIVLRKSDDYTANRSDWIQLHVHKVNDNGNEIERRYDICSRNALLCTEKLYEEEAAFVIRLRENERLQITASASSRCICTLTATSTDRFQINPFPSFYECTIEGILTKRDVLNSSLVLTNTSQEKVEKIVVALSQEPVRKRTHSVGLELWVNPDFCCEDGRPHFVTEFRRDVLVVFCFDLCVKPNDKINIIPLTKKHSENVPFAMSVYSSVPLERENKMI
ncbi:putative cysteine peptidase, Clan CA, family C2 [Trypanosoma cruzi]|nr:putative cysteine peptidase, Clan CA, family C2 [Trypanosoma cruzi]